MVHCTAAGIAPAEVARERFRLTAPPERALPELNETVACWATAWLAIASASKPEILKTRNAE